MTRNDFNLLYAIKKNGLLSQRDLAKKANVSLGFVSETLRDFNEKGLVDESGLTSKGEEALEPYKVKNAIIMAAGMSTRFVPLSLEKPKGLLIVKDEVLIERQIEQLIEAGIKDIILVLGYKKESFFYLEDKYGLKIVINPEYNTKNNIETLYLAQKYIGNSYICSSDDYFEENVFEPYVYQSYYAAIHVNEKSNEWYMIPDSKFNVSKVEKSGEEGYVMLGHVYFDNEFAKEFVKLINEHHDLGDYDQNLWEDLFADNVTKLPPMEIKVYPDDVIFEFDSLEELRKFDEYYVKNTHSKIMKNICSILNCDETHIVNFKAINEGLTNTSFAFDVKGERYVYRHPGDGTSEIISREHEKKSLELAKSIDVDPTFIYMDSEEAWKISKFVKDIRIPSYDSFEDSKRLLKVLRKLHDQNLSVDWEFLPWEEACKIEKILKEEKDGIADPEFESLKSDVERCYKATIGDGVEKRFCHCDTYAPNWMFTDDGQAILIDWEYAGNADPGNDLGCYIMDAMWDIETTTEFIKEYCQESYNEKFLFHYLPYVAIVSYYWYVWALYRESCGAIIGEYLHNWYVMAKRYSKYLVENFDI